METKLSSANTDDFKSIIDASMDGYLLLDPSGRILEANAAYCTISGYGPHELVGMYWHDLHAVDDRDALVEQGERRIHIGKGRHETVHRRKDGSITQVEVSCVSTPTDGGRVHLFIQDISERKKVERALQQSEERYRRFTGLTSDFVYMCERAPGKPFRIQWLGGAFETITGYSKDELLNLGCWLPLVDEEDRERIAKGLIDMRPGDNATATFRLRTKSGDIRWLQEACRCEAGGEPDHLVLYGSSQDITARKQAEMAMKESEERFRSIMALSPDIISIIDEHGIMTYNSPATMGIHGYSEAEMAGIDTFDLIHPDDRQNVSNIFSKLLGNPSEIVSVQYRYRNKDGSFAWMEATSCNQLDNPLIRGVIAISRDISDRKASERDRLDMARKLLHAQKLESLGTMAGGIAHDFNNLLAVILGNLDLALLHLPPESPVQGYLQGSMKASRRAADLTRQMLAYSGKSVFNVQLIDINDIVTENVSLFRTVIPKNISFDVSTADDMPLITADPGQIQQVVMNLITNAAEAIDTKQGTIKLATGSMECDNACLQKSVLLEKPSPGSFVYVEVSDTGCGMNEEAKQRIFEPFFTTKFTGRGLGMAAAQGIVTSHNGAILLESVEGQGTSFRILFPASAGAAPQPDPREQERDTERIVTSHAKGVILVVDDEDDVRSVAADYVRYLGFEAYEASNGIEAMAIFQRHADSISTVILDLIMPDMDGVETYREMKAIRPDVRIILSSGFSELAVAEYFHDEKPDAFIQKPFQVHELQQKIARVSA